MTLWFVWSMRWTPNQVREHSVRDLMMIMEASESMGGED